ncbi:MAG: hypothetical protein IJP17_00585, partial [Clostridia bacterium]|nr:hypothetical protein [Clostridia bacterium]
SPMEAAKRIAALSEDAFIPDSVPLGTALPLSEAELKTLYKSNVSLTPSEEALLASGAPDSTEMISPSRFSQVCAIVGKTDPELVSAGVDFWKSDVERDVSVLSDVCASLRYQAERIASAEQWMLRAAQAGVSGKYEGSVYELIEQSVPKLRELAAEIMLPVIDSQPYIPEELVSEESGKILAEIVEEIDTEKINWLTIALHPKWKQLLDKCIINGEKPDTRSEVDILCKYNSLLVGRKALQRRWDSTVASLGGPAIGGDCPEEQAAQVWSSVKGWLGWYHEVWQPLCDKLSSLGFDLERYSEKQPIESRIEGEVYAAKAALCADLPSLVEDEYYRGDRGECIAMLENASRTLLPYVDDYPTAAALRCAIESRDSEQYASAYDEYDKITLKRDVYAHRTELLDRLHETCPMWASQISGREGRNGGECIPGDLQSDWLRAQLCGELDSRDTTAIAEVQGKIERLNAQLSVITGELIACKAWSAQLRTLHDTNKKRALATWAELVKRVGKGTGKRAEQLLASGE